MSNVRMLPRERLIEIDQTDQQNETAECKIDGDFPGRGMPFAGAPDADEQKGRDQCQLVKGVEEDEILRRKRSGRTRAR